MTRIAVISDLHIGKKAISLDLCPHQLLPEESVAFIDEYLTTFRQYVASSDFKKGGPVDMLCVTGDISNEARPEEFRLAHQVITGIAQELGVELDQIYFVPGNHDLHWPVMKLEPTDFWTNYRYDPLLQDGLIFQSRNSEATTGTFKSSPHFVAWNGDQNLVIGINSAAFDGPEPGEGKHHGLVHEDTLCKLETYLDSVPVDNEGLRICLIHHHPVAYSDISPNVPDFSILTNAENLFSLLSKHRFDLVVHGHKHIPHILHAPFVNNGHPVTILGAGSFSARLESKWVGKTQNQFHIVNVEGRDATTGVAFGYVATWDFAGGKWSESHSQLGLCATENFGSLATPYELTNIIANHIDQILLTKTMCTWDDLVSLTPRLAHSNTKAAYEAFVSVGHSRNLIQYGEIDSKQRKWALIRV